ncbi:CTP synthase 2 [Galemys pyrenaicus]|uniref:CTP synthase (glutamine hydrolyzing) n=1 Tax=Galemys pyrenaicus TaxID=202257 RepID=A0A8J5ZW02_GALPY|nr:CTP synthase 2 [Galemys pyrenaicus]
MSHVVVLISDHPYFVGVQFHPEFSSRPMKPSPPYLGLLLAATGNLNAYLQQGCKLSSRRAVLVQRAVALDACARTPLARMHLFDCHTQ